HSEPFRRNPSWRVPPDSDLGWSHGTPRKRVIRCRWSPPARESTALPRPIFARILPREVARTTGTRRAAGSRSPRWDSQEPRRERAPEERAGRPSSPPGTQPLRRRPGPPRTARVRGVAPRAGLSFVGVPRRLHLTSRAVLSRPARRPGESKRGGDPPFPLHSIIPCAATVKCYPPLLAHPHWPQP